MQQTMPIFEVVLMGFDSDDSNTDYLVKWVASHDQDTLEAWLETAGLNRFVDGIEQLTLFAYPEVEFGDGLDAIVHSRLLVDQDPKLRDQSIAAIWVEESMQAQTQQQKRESEYTDLVLKIAGCVVNIDVADLTTAEKKIAVLLEKHGVLQEVQDTGGSYYYQRPTWKRQSPV